YVDEQFTGRLPFGKLEIAAIVVALLVSSSELVDRIVPAAPQHVELQLLDRPPRCADTLLNDVVPEVEADLVAPLDPVDVAGAVVLKRVLRRHAGGEVAAVVVEALRSVGIRRDCEDRRCTRRQNSSSMPVHP